MKATTSISSAFKLTCGAGFIIFVMFAVLLLKPITPAGFIARNPSSTSINEAKWAVLNPPGARKHVEGKGRSAVAIEIFQEGEQVIYQGRPFMLQARLTANQDFGLLQWDWVLPDNVDIVAGSEHGEQAVVEEGQVVTLQITVVANSITNEQIHLHAYQMAGGEAVGDIGHFNTQPQLVERPMTAESTGESKAQSEDGTTVAEPPHLIQ